MQFKEYYIGETVGSGNIKFRTFSENAPSSSLNIISPTGAISFADDEYALRVKYYSDIELQNEITTIEPGSTVYMAIELYNAGNSLYKSFEFGWNASSAVSAGITFAGLYTGTTATDRTAIASATGMSASAANALYNTYIRPKGFVYKASSNSIAINTPNSDMGNLSISLSNSEDIGLFDEWGIIGLFQMNIPANISSISLTKVNARIDDVSYISVFEDIVLQSN